MMFGVCRRIKIVLFGVRPLNFGGVTPNEVKLKRDGKSETDRRTERDGQTARDGQTERDRQTETQL